jgi:superfamily II DNA or RNA helicase
MSKMNTSNWLATNVPHLEQRQYQLEAWEALWGARERGENRALIQLATGLGKTSVAAVDVLYYRKKNPHARFLFVSHMVDISRQGQASFLRVDPSLTTNLFRRKLTDVQMTFATFQGLYQQLTNIKPNHFDYIIWDEAHHTEAETFSAVRKHFTPQFELALTATPSRADGRDILGYFGEPVYSKGLSDGIAEGWLSAVDYHIVFDDAIKRAMSEDFSLNTLHDIRGLFSHRARNETISREVLQRRHQIGLDKAKTIVFCQNIKAAEVMAQLLKGEVYHSDLPIDDRAQVLSRFRKGHLQVICTVDMFNEGIDIPDARLVVFLRSTSSRTIFEQQLGRGLRRHPGKDTVTVLDFVANVERINFVRDLGHTISQYQGSSETYSGKNKGGMRTSHTPSTNFTVSNFVFEDKSIELLERYITLKNHQHLTTAEVVAAYTQCESVQMVAKQFGVSWNAIVKHLKRAGINSQVHKARSISTEEVVAKYKELGSIKKVSQHFNIDVTTVRVRLRKVGVKVPANKKIYASPELIDAYHRLGSVTQAAKAVGMSKFMALSRFKNSGISTSKYCIPTKEAKG